MGRWSGARVTNARAYWTARILELANAGRFILCPFCGLPVTLDKPWDVDHAELLDTGGILGRPNQRPSHRGCNRKAGAQHGNRKRSRLSRRIRG